ncbi:MAG: 5-methyltetrahydropteroyltriglutamate--homocysteine S-methyltransferase [Nevskiales bacterium]
MPDRTSPPFRADHVGSLLRPPELLHARDQHARGEISRRQLRAAEDAAIREAVRRQQEIGLKAVTDGEFRRTWFHLDFLQEFAGVTVVQSPMKARFHTASGEIEMQPSALQIVGRISRPQPIFVDDFKYLQSIASAVPKLTLPSPSLMHFRGGRRAIDPAIYPDMAEFYADLARGYAEEIRDLAASGCRYIQLDEVNLAYLCDPALAAHVRNIGEDPASLPQTYAGLINAAIASRPSDMVVCMHLCRGNFQSGWVAEGGYDPVAELLFNGIDVDGYFLEYDSPRSGGFAPLRFVPKGKIVVVGLVTSKSGALESKDELKRRIDEASRYLPMDQLALSPQCGFSSTVEGNLLGIEEQYAKLRLVAEVAREVWG